MFKTTLKGFYQNSKYVLMVAGIVYLAIILFVYFLITALFLICGENLKLLFEDIVKITSAYMSGFTFSSLLEVPTLFNSILKAVDFHIGEFFVQIITLILGLLVFLYIACELGKSFAIISIKQERFKSNMFWILISISIRTIISLAFTVLFVYLSFKWVYSLIFLVIFYLVLKAILNIIYIKLSKRKGIRLKKLFSVKTVLTLIGMYVISFVMFSLLAVLFFFAFNVVVAVLLVLPISIYLNACVEGISYGMFEIHS